MKNKRIIFFLIDGFCDKSNLQQTPLRLSKKIFLSQLLPQSFLSYIYPLKKSQWPLYGERSVSGLANLGILGYQVKPERFKRGVYEALGSDIFYKNGWLAFRVNFATIDNKFFVRDRRIGRNPYGIKILLKDLNKIKFKVPFEIYHTLGHRGVLIFKAKLSDYLTTNDPFEVGRKVRKIKPLKLDSLSKKTAQLVNEFVNLAYLCLKDHYLNKKREKEGLPPINYLLLREPGNKLLKLKNFFEKYQFKNGVVIAQNGVDKGVCQAVGFSKYSLKDALTIKQELNSVKKALDKVYKKFVVLFIHIKKADEASHDKNFEKKKQFFEEFDVTLKQIFKNYPKDLYVITGDHITDTKTGKHLFGPVPLLIINSNIKNEPQELSEIEALKKGIFFKNNALLWKFLKKNVN